MAEVAQQTEALAKASDLFDVDALRLRVDAVLADDLYWFPVRHHSPAVARHLETALLERKPTILFIEGPADAHDLIRHVVDAKTKPPIAIYSSYRDDDNVLGLAGIASPAPDIPARFSSWYPMLAYSPEYVAMTTATKLKIEVVFIDLPHHALIKPIQPDAIPEPNQAKPAHHHTEQFIAESGFYQRLAQVAGYRSWNEAWDAMFETRTFADGEELRRELATFCAAARATTPRARIESDDTLPRERFMWRTIRKTLAERGIAAKDAMVVCGGFHLFLDPDDDTPPPEPPKGVVYNTVVPYSYFRISELSGYGAGNRAPQYYQRLWDLLRDDRPEDLLAQHVVETLKQTRKKGEVASSADAIAVCQNARLLARLRGRDLPVLDDIHDALITCVCKGNPAEEGTHLRAAMDHVDIGSAIGKVTGAIGRLPIVDDFYQRLDELELTEVVRKEKRLNLDLDKREEPQLRRSVFLHRLRMLGVELAGLTQAPSTDFATGKIFREKWALKWTPAIESQLIEQNLYGDTIEVAVAAKLREELAKDGQDAAKVCARLVQSIDMDLPNLIQQAHDMCGLAIDNDPRFASLSQALSMLCVLERHAVFRQVRHDQLLDLLERCYDRSCFALPDAASVPEDQQEAVIGGLKTVAEVLGRADVLNLDRVLFTQQVRSSANGSTVAFLRGAFLGMLVELRDLPAEDLANEVSALAKAPTDIMIQAGDFLDGVLAVSRSSIMVGADALIGAIDELLRAAEWEPFLTMLPRMRAAFERLSGHQVESLANKVAERYGLKEAASLTKLSTSVGAAARIAGIDRRVAEIMRKWDF